MSSHWYNELKFACCGLTALVLALGCSAAHGPDSNGQTHWLQQCDSDDECGELSCLCGVCSAPCKGSDGCKSAVGEDSVCTPAALAGGPEACTGKTAEALICVAQCSRDLECSAIGEHLACASGICKVRLHSADAGPIDGRSDASEAHDDAGGDGDDDAAMDGAIDDAAMDGAIDDAATDAATDAEVDSGSAGTEAKPDAAIVDEPDIVDIDAEAAVELSCTDTEDLVGEGEGEFEVVATDSFEEELAVAPDGTIYTTHIEGSNSVLVRLEGSTSEAFTPAIFSVDMIDVDGGELIVGIPYGPTEDTVIASIDLATEQRVNIASESAYNPLGTVIESDLIYWMSDGATTSSSGQLWRSPRTPGQTQMIGAFMGAPVRRSLFAAGDALFFLAQVGPDFRMYSAPKDGSSEPELLSGAPTGIADMRYDGDSAYLALGGQVDDLGNPTGEHGIARMDPDTLDSETLFYTTATPEFMTVDSTYVYWIINEGYQGDGLPTESVWRSRKDGSGGAEALARLHGWMLPLVAHGGSLYWIAICPQRAGRSHIVRVPSP